MRNAAANFDDLDFEGPARKKAPARTSSSKKGAKRKKAGKGRFRFDFDMQKVARYAAIGMSVTVAMGIMVNALVMQKGRHPAPLFATAAPAGDTKPSQPKAEVTAAKPHADVAPAAPAAQQQAQTPTPAKRAESAAASPDAIGRFLQDGSIPADRADQKSVLDAQRALIKLGFAVKATGTLGPQTKKAIERFEKDHHLPVKGELSRKVVKLLASASGLKIEH